MSNFYSSRPGTPTPHDEEHALSLLPQHQKHNKESAPADGHAGHIDGFDGFDVPTAATTAASSPSLKIKCLDGLRGVACFLVFNYHFLWPWTPLIMLGYGARPPKSPEPYLDPLQLPILCLLHRGRPMVAIFFAISGYVLCRHIQAAIHARRLDDAYKKLASAVFRRVFRLYIPCTVSMFAVAVLVQLGLFRSEQAIYKGPDSAWINGTVTKGFFINGTTCPNMTVAVEGRAGVAAVLGLETPLYLNETIGDSDRLCLDLTSRQHSAAIIYGDIDKPKKKPSNSKANATMPFRDFAEYHRDDPHNPASGASDEGISTKSTLTQAAESLLKGHLASSHRDVTGSPRRLPPQPVHQNFTWIQLGGSWEEHPLIHPHIFKALANFTVVYTEWANPFNFGHMHPRYDPHTWTIPKELRGSMVLYTFLLGTAALRARWRIGAAIGLSIYALTLGYWDMGVFVGGMIHSELDLLRNAASPSEFSADDRALVRFLRAAQPPPTRKARILRWALIILALYLLSYPDAGAEFTPGFRFLAWLAPRWYIPVSKWMFYQAIGALILLPCVLRSPTLRSLLEGRLAQYLGRISFAFYLVHGPVLHSLGFWIMPRLFEALGRVGGYVVGYFVLLGTALWLAGWFCRRVDVPSLGVGKSLEKALVNY